MSSVATPPASRLADRRIVASPGARRLASRPLYAFLVQFPAVAFVGALLTDLSYWQTDLFLWETFSVWLLAFGCVMAGLAGLVGLFHFVFDRRVRTAPRAAPHALVSFAAAALSVVNAFVHSRDGYTAVVPTGLSLSAIVVVLMAVAAWLGRGSAADETLRTERVA